ncbi:MAG: peroxiredoxin [Alphaproteobacteria bacterium]|jgi:glutaredoxin/glutathione-dependent peroxiredoxin|nr:peroxiredoxin [Alphaproteobacteria bacterium]MBT7944145.1 peroxiredoxin [Alphaproteobacteria bacterium]
MTIQTGDTIPNLTLHVMGEDGGPQAISTDELFKGKLVALFGLPGAFTPTCSASHLPGYVQNADALKAKGVDDIICVSVNDAFVMAAWGKDQGVGDKVRMVADGSAEFATATGLELDLGERGLGLRCQRFSMIVDNGVVQDIETEAPPSAELTGAEKMLEKLP